MPSSERVVLSFAQSAAQAGAQLANYVAVTNFIRQGNYVTGVQAQDFLSGNELAIRSKLIINATGPWLDETLAPLTGHRPSRILQFSKAFNLLISRQIASGYAVGLYSRKYFRDTDALLQKGARLLFIIPWYGGSLIGTAHCFHRGDPENLTVSDEEVALFLDEINDAYPAAKLTRDDVSYVYGGLLPATNHGIGGVQLVKRHRIYDHIQDGISGLISVNGVKFTEARYVAEKTVDLALKKLGRRPIRSTTAVTPLYGGRMDVIELHRDGAARRDRLPLDGDMVQDLIFHYGSAYPEVVKYLDSRSASTHDGSNRLALIKAQIQYGVQEEMAQTLADIVFRRIMLARSGHPGAAHLRTCALVMAQELGWAPTKTEEEIKHVEAILRSHHAFDYLLDSKVLQPWRERDNDERHSVAISHV
jgi:glycerol-3-phosphate dehydrogenase